MPSENETSLEPGPARPTPGEAAEAAGRDIFSTFAAQAWAALAGALVGILTARLLGPTGRGALALLQNDALLLATFLSLETSGLVFFAANRRIRLDALVGFHLSILAAGTLACAALLAGLERLGVASFFLPASVAPATAKAFVLAFYVLSAATEIAIAVLQGRNRFGSVNRLGVWTSGASALVFSALLALQVWRPARVGLEEALVALVALAALKALLLLASAARATGTWPGLGFTARAVVVPLLSFAAPAQLSSWANFLNYRLDTWIVGHFAGQTALGLYSLAVGVSQLLWLLAYPVQPVVFRLTAAREAASEAVVAMASRFCVTLTVLAALALGAAADWLVPLVYGRGFSGAVPALRILLVGAAFGAFTKVWAGYIAGRGGVRYNLTAVLLGLAATVVLDLALIPRLGIVGASIATTVAYALIAAVCAGALVLRLGVRPGNCLLVTPDDLRQVLRGLARA